MRTVCHPSQLRRLYVLSTYHINPIANHLGFNVFITLNVRIVSGTAIYQCIIGADPVLSRNAKTELIARFTVIPPICFSYTFTLAERDIRSMTQISRRQLV